MGTSLLLTLQMFTTDERSVVPFLTAAWRTHLPRTKRLWQIPLRQRRQLTSMVDAYQLRQAALMQRAQALGNRAAARVQPASTPQMIVGSHLASQTAS
jgi:hypothetical protein